VFRDHPLGHPVGGDADDLPTFTAQQVVDRHLRGLTATPTCIALVGDASALPDALEALRTSDLPAMARRGDGPLRKPPVIAPSGGATLSTPAGAGYAYVVAGGQGVSRDDELWAAFEVLSAAVGGTAGSILYAALRDALGLTYQLHSVTTNFSDGGLWHVVAGSTPDELAEVEAVIRRCLEVVAEGRLPRAHLRAAVTQSLGAVLIDNEDPVARAHLDAFYGANGLLDEAPVTRARREIARVGMADVVRAARQVLQTYTAVAAA
jgi:predicted Zn-dependent peptidase